jgi:hypothetical protein
MLVGAPRPPVIGSGRRPQLGRGTLGGYELGSRDAYGSHSGDHRVNMSDLEISALFQEPAEIAQIAGNLFAGDCAWRGSGIRSVRIVP